MWYVPCPPTNIDAVAPIILTDLHSGSHLYLNRDGSVRTSPRPDYRTDEGRNRFDALLADSSLMKLVLTFPECSPPLPQMSLEYGGRAYQGWIDNYCWPTQTDSRFCDDTVGAGPDGASPVLMKRGDEFSIVVSSDDPSPSEVTTSVFTVLETGPVLKMGEEVYPSDALDRLPLDIPSGFYVLSTVYKSQLGEVTYGFKVEIGATAATPREQSPPPPLPQVSLEHGGRSHQGRRGSYCWPVSANSSICADSAGWEGFEKASAVMMKRGGMFSIVVSGDDSSPGQVQQIRVYTVRETEPFLRRGGKKSIQATQWKDLPLTSQLAFTISAPSTSPN